MAVISAWAPPLRDFARTQSYKIVLSSALDSICTLRRRTDRNFNVCPALEPPTPPPPIVLEDWVRGTTSPQIDFGGPCHMLRPL